jgi:hypothetical protein
VGAGLGAGRGEHEPDPLGVACFDREHHLARPRGQLQQKPPSRVRSLGLVVTSRMRGARVAAANWTRTMVAWRMPLLPSALAS